MGLLDGKVALIVGIANERSYAFHIAKSLTEHGCTCALSKACVASTAHTGR